MAKATKKFKTPNYHAIVFGMVILVMFMLFVNSDISTYMDIVHVRDNVAESVRTASLDIEAIEEGYKKCSEDMNSLREKSPLGNVLADLDKSTLGQISNNLLIAAIRAGALYVLCIVIREMWKQLQIILHNAKMCWNGKKKNSSAAREVV